MYEKKEENETTATVSFSGFVWVLFHHFAYDSDQTAVR